MSFEEFKEILREKVADTVDGEVTVVTVPKNNGVQLDALNVKRTGCNIAPVVYLAGYYNDYNKGRSIENIVEGIVSLCEREAGISEEIINDFKVIRKLEKNTQFKIKAEREYLRSHNRGELGVRVQMSNISSPTEDEAIANIEIEEAFKNGEIDSSILKGIDNDAQYEKLVLFWINM